MIHCLCGTGHPESEMVPLWDLIFVCKDCVEKYRSQSEWTAYKIFREVKQRREQKYGG